ncbi:MULTISPECIES: GNAT family N-acetyltransferase [Phyllobacteriaceae]|jgi:ribosomal protein S18 acetylase RimI-like enzyme|uniref:GNAT family N-acetyltransferase n=1 Tax=Mesorhizobium hungaricum TaxID=1566387 RepID=A0A1C2DI42_9HYPH|nr:MULTISPECIES: N-acetyltransferase [Mesorhizobium]MBN9234498.1 GNAT family N-acetyltransferase [Mesorhizobium sp.]MDQ0332567.1 ribosomal protein S18 acetylase RimI-like enzyme [Mesorhizobium sp. YL-MeA3-2017]OCX14431.1 GNAT family N-acetyltransferase [Mesorhizobium hungaricum]
MFVRTAGERDLETIRALLAETWHATYDAIYGVEGVTAISEHWHSVTWLKQLLRQPRSEFIVADTGAELAGVAHAVMKEDELVEVTELDVRPSMQGRGVGGLLLAELEDSFPECRLMRLEVEEKNQRARDFYRANGFVEFGRRPATQWVDAMIVSMEKRLG